jgi:hypothetical protein
MPVSEFGEDQERILPARRGGIFMSRSAILLVLFACGTFALAQHSGQKMTDQDVIDMVGIGLSDDVIIAKVRSVPATNFDTTVAGLKSLKAAKVSDAVLKAMIDPHGSSADKPLGRGSNLGGRALVAKAVEYMGGISKLQSIKSLSLDFMWTPRSRQGQDSIHIKSILVFPDQIRIEATTSGGPIIEVISPDASFVWAPNTGAQDRPVEQRVDGLREIHRHPIYVGQHLNDPDFVFVDAGMEKIGGMETRIVDIDGPGVSVRWFVELQTGRILREAYSMKGLPDVTDSDEWRASDGLTLPYLRKSGQGTVRYNSIEINPVVDTKIFERPGAPAGGRDTLAHTAATPAGDTRTTVQSPTQLALLNKRGYRSEGGAHLIVEGQVRNISNAPLKSVEAVVSWYTNDGQFVSSDHSLIEYDPLLPDQTSPFTVYSNFNPEKKRFSVELKLFSGSRLAVADQSK